MTAHAATEELRTEVRGYPPWLFGYAVALIAAAVPITAAALARAVIAPPTASVLAGAAVFFVLTLLAELKPVPLDVEERHVVSLAFIFVSSSQLLFGWHIAVLIGASAILLAQLVGGTTWLRTLFNSAVYALAALAAALPSFTGLNIGHGEPTRHFVPLTAMSFLQGAIFVTVNVSLVCVAIALFERQPFRGILKEHVRHSLPAFVVMGFLAALAVALWTVDPLLLVLLAGPLFTLSLYQRYALRTKEALRDASTDSLTGLGNHRSFEQEIAALAERSTSAGTPFSLCLLDVDDFKRINDRHGHPAGDRALVEFAALLANTGAGAEAFRLGGDEFALLVDGGGSDAVSAVERLRARLPESLLPDGELVTFSAGIASCPASADDAQELQRVADLALYWTKRHGKNRLCVYNPSVLEISWTQELAATAEYEARLRAAENLIRVVDARDTYTGSHSGSVSRLAEAIGRALGLRDEQLVQLRLAALLHDLGKVAIPDQILRKPIPLTASETALLRRHPQLGFDLLEGLDVHPVDLWILHHHESWDGSGYPHGLAGEEIPIGSRIILVADAFDALTTERSYRRAISVEAAMEELRRCSGTQFDPAVVAALDQALDSPATLVAAGVA